MTFFFGILVANKAIAKGKEAIADKLDGVTIVKEIYVPGRIVNIVVK